MIRNSLKKVMDNYLANKSNPFSKDNEIFQLFKFGLTDAIEEVVPASKYTIKSSAGLGNWAAVPWVVIFDKDLIDKGTLTYNVGYLFKEDMSGVYLSLNLMVRDYSDLYGSDRFQMIENDIKEFRNIISAEFDISDLETSIDLASRGNTPRGLEKANVIAKYYDKNNLPSEEDLIEDLKEFLEIYSYLIVENSKDVYISPEQWIEVLNNSEVIDEKMTDILKIIYNSNNHAATISEIVEKRKKEEFLDEKSYNARIVQNGKRLVDYFGKNDILNEDGAKIYWKWFFTSQWENEEFQFVMREELVEAFDMLREEEIFEDVPSFMEYLKLKGFLFDPEIVEDYLLSLKVKPFVIFTGNSGTGKTKLAQLFVDFIQNNYSLVNLNKEDVSSNSSSKKSFVKFAQYELIPVGANWTESRNILGFRNVITGKYEETPAYNLIKEAQKNNQIPFFLILDEMNLSHVERYFAEFLSAMESQESIPISAKESLNIPKNLFIVGTVNVDETTYMFSPKVLDRANTIEFKTMSASDYMNSNFENYHLNGDESYLINPQSDEDIRNLNIHELKAIFKDVKYKDQLLWDVLSNQLEEFQSVLKKANFDFGFRVINEILRFMVVSWKYEGEPQNWENWQRYFDAQIKQKMLPKLHGSQKLLGPVIKELFELCLNNPQNNLVPRLAEIDKDDIKYCSSALKLQEMDQNLYNQRYTSFVN